MNTKDDSDRASSDSPPGALRLSRVVVEELDAILGLPFRVLDDGFVRVVDYLGGDSAVVQAARVSYGAGTRKVNEDRGLIRYLMRHAHTTPFEMCELKLHIRAPMDCWRQWIRHRTASVNEYSTRYSVAIDVCQRTDPGQWRQQSSGNRQGSSGFVEPTAGEHLSARETELQVLARDVYKERLLAGVAREQARKDLPLSTYTEAYWKIDLHNLLHFLALRMDSHAQVEIRDFANVIGNEIVSRWCPLTWEAFREYRQDGISLSRLEREVASHIIRGDRDAALGAATHAGVLLIGEDGHLRPSRERDELEFKLSSLGLNWPWQSLSE
jgi:thymidylate synthase (FAD)